MWSYDWLLPRPFPPSSVRKLSLFLSLGVCRPSSLLTGEGGNGLGRSKIIRPRDSLVLNKSFSTLWSERPMLQSCMILFLHLCLYCWCCTGGGEVCGGVREGGGKKEGTEKEAEKVHRKRNHKGEHPFLESLRLAVSPLSSPRQQLPPFPLS